MMTKEKYEILTYPNPFLKNKAQKIRELTREIKFATEKMINTLVNEDNGIGLASTQVGIPWSIVVFWENDDHKKAYPNQPNILYNAEIIAHDIEFQGSVEGCLSLPGLLVPVKRYITIVVKGRAGLEWKKLEQTYKGETAIILQHEIDHLNGLTLLDKISKLKKQMFAKKIKKEKKQHG